MFDTFFPQKLAYTKFSNLLIFRVLNFNLLKIYFCVTLLTIDKFKLTNYDIKLKKKKASS